MFNPPPVDNVPPGVFLYGFDKVSRSRGVDKFQPRATWANSTCSMSKTGPVLQFELGFPSIY